MPYIIVLLLIVLAVIFGPLAVVWAINTLWGVGLGYTFWTWLAAAVLIVAFSGGRS